MIRARLTLEPDARICLESTYDEGFVEVLKRVIPRESRNWEPARKRWLVSALYVTDLLGVLQQCGAQVTDDRPPPAPLQQAPGPTMPDELREAYAVLFLAPNAPLPVVEAVYRHLAKLLHPDHGGDAEAFYRINDAIGTIRRYAAVPEDQHTDDDVPF